MLFCLKFYFFCNKKKKILSLYHILSLSKSILIYTYLILIKRSGWNTCFHLRRRWLPPTPLTKPSLPVWFGLNPPPHTYSLAPCGINQSLKSQKPNDWSPVLILLFACFSLAVWLFLSLEGFILFLHVIFFLHYLMLIFSTPYFLMKIYHHL